MYQTFSFCPSTKCIRSGISKLRRKHQLLLPKFRGEVGIVHSSSNYHWKESWNVRVKKNALVEKSYTLETKSKLRVNNK